MAKRILLVDDEPLIVKGLKYTLEQEGFETDSAADGDEALTKFFAGHYDFILLDVMLPKVDGFELMQYLRPTGTPVIFITAKNSLTDRVRGLRMGAEDYIVKPFEILELLARVDVVLRRYHKTEAVLEVGGLRIDTVAMQVTRGGAAIALTKKEYDLLLLFARNPGVALYRETIYERVWNEEFPYGSRTVDLHIQRLRKKAGWEDCLRAVNKVGYRLEV